MESTLALTDSEFLGFASKLKERAGLHFTAANRPILESRVLGRMKETDAPTAATYLQRISDDPRELDGLLDTVTTKLTRFFRNEPHMEALRDHVLPELMATKTAGGSLHAVIWSAGCSTGEEVYSLAMLADEVAAPGFTFEIVGSDISLSAILHAQAGEYAPDRVANVPDRYLDRYFEKRGERFAVSERLRRMTRFEYSNLHNDNGLRAVDVLFCRNVLIYFDAATQHRAAERLFDAMAEDGYLFIGHSESLHGLDIDLELHRAGPALVYRKALGGQDR